MTSPAECLEGVLHTVTGPGMGVYWQPAGTPDAIDDHLRNVTAAMTTPGKVTVFVRADQVAAGIDPALRTNLLRGGQLPANVQIKLINADGTRVTDATLERAAANALDLPVTSAQGAPDRVAVDNAGQATASEQPAAHLVLPDAMNVQRRAAIDAFSGKFSSLADLMGAYDDGVAGGTSPHTAWHALAVYLTVVHAAGAPVPSAVSNLTRQPMITAAQLAEAIGGPEGLQKARPHQLAAHLKQNPRSFALVVGDDQVHALLPQGSDLRWLPPGQTAPVFEVDGAEDPFTELLEQPGAQVLVLDRTGVRQVTAPLDRAPAVESTVINPPTGTTVGAQHETQVGEWPPQTMSRLGLDAVDIRQIPTITVDARFAEETAGHVRNLNARQTSALTNAGFRHWIEDSRPLIISTADTPQVREVARKSGGVAVFPTKTVDGLDVRSSLSMYVPGAAELENLGDGRRLTQSMINRAEEVLDNMPELQNKVPAVLKALLSLNSYPEAQDYWDKNYSNLQSKLVGETLDRLTGVASSANNWFAVMKLAHTIAVRTQAYQNGPEPIEPIARNSMETEPALPAGVTPDVRFVFDFLNARELPPVAPGTEAPGPYQTRLLWDGVLFRMMLGRNLTAAEVMVLTNGVNADDYSRATRNPEAFIASESHAAIFAAIWTLQESGLATLNEAADGVKTVTIDWSALAEQLAKCRNGEDRLPWHFRTKDVLLPHLAGLGLTELLAPAMVTFRNLIYLCH